jgi:hypothetical protein
LVSLRAVSKRAACLAAPDIFLQKTVIFSETSPTERLDKQSECNANKCDERLALVAHRPAARAAHRG